MDSTRTPTRRWPLLRVVVSGSSMEPTLSDGDWLLCRFLSSTDRLEEGDVVVARRPDRPELLVVKRVVRRERDGWWLEGDNAEASDDSRLFGVVPDDCVVARVFVRYLPLPRRV
jgi:nickel-type superoxide dismutase maturation protease